mmetsp:Transcript_47115/g.118674  ORF Transcript_47115/g.118674 Transcript_47115/m.118674 type:complete len:246 (+) Transcript_47115:557-1294(+)
MIFGNGGKEGALPEACNPAARRLAGTGNSTFGADGADRVGETLRAARCAKEEEEVVGSGAVEWRSGCSQTADEEDEVDWPGGGLSHVPEPPVGRTGLRKSSTPPQSGAEPTRTAGRRGGRPPPWWRLLRCRTRGWESEEEVMAIKAVTTLLDVGGSATGGAGSWKASGSGTWPTTICPTTIVGASEPHAEEPPPPRQAERSSSVRKNTLCSGVGSTDSMCMVLRSPVPHKLLLPPPFRGVTKVMS